MVKYLVACDEHLKLVEIAVRQYTTSGSDIDVELLVEKAHTASFHTRGVVVQDNI